MFAGVADTAIAPMLAAIRSRMPGVPVYASGGMLAREPGADPRRTRARRGAHPDPAPIRARRRSRRLLARLRAAGAASGPEAVYGYGRCGSCSRPSHAAAATASVIAAALRYREPDSALGSVRIRPTGDAEEARFALHALAGGRFAFERTLP